MKYLAALTLLALLAACGGGTKTPATDSLAQNQPIAPDTLNRFDTLETGGYRILLLPATEAEYNTAKDVSAWRIACNDLEGEERFNCLGKWMRGLLVSDSTFVSRPDSLTLRIRLKNGNSLFLRDTLYTEANEGDVRLNEYMGKLSSLPWIIVGRTYYEAFDAAAYNLNTGKEVSLMYYPILSPRKNLLLVYNFDLEAGYTFNGLQLLSLSGDNATVVFERAYDKWGATNAKWISENEALIEQSVPDYGSAEYKLTKYYARLVIK
ncbi:MAG: hypothetical protein MUC87_16270 [Bacteroidia bacterium]|jgi:hypothetical protein|nr:hypothetical protein [Bacteroidia bacterium]